MTGGGSAPRAAARLFWLFVVGHALIWVFVPMWAQPNGHRDVIELLDWGKHPAWGYWKHPPLQSWVAAAVVRLTGHPYWGVYVGAQLGLTVTFWAVWRLARDLVSPGVALLSVLLLEGIFFYNYNSPKFNHDALQLPLWALIVLLLWRALGRGWLRDWLACGMVMGLGVLSKYGVVFLLGPLALFVLVDPRARRWLRAPGPYVALATAGLVVAPHLVWLARHHFPTITYGLDRAAREGAWLDHVVNPLNFAVNQLLTLLPVWLLLGALRGRGGPEPAAPQLPAFGRAFLATVTLGPFLAYLLVSAVTGLRLLSGWATPLWSFVGLFLLTQVRPRLDPAAWRRFGGLFAAIALFWVVAFAAQFTVGPHLTGQVRPEHFPGQQVADFVTAAWRARYATPLPVVAGDKGLVDNVGVYSRDRPDVYDLREADPLRNHWVDDAGLRRRGGVLVWDARLAGADLPPSWRARFPGAVAGPSVPFAWQTSVAVRPVELGWALLPPAGE